MKISQTVMSRSLKIGNGKLLKNGEEASEDARPLVKILNRLFAIG
jgi:gamma-glutamyl phosphate reductase